MADGGAAALMTFCGQQAIRHKHNAVMTVGAMRKFLSGLKKRARELVILTQGVYNICGQAIALSFTKRDAFRRAGRRNGYY